MAVASKNSYPVRGDPLPESKAFSRVTRLCHCGSFILAYPLPNHALGIVCRLHLGVGVQFEGRLRASTEKSNSYISKRGPESAGQPKRSTPWASRVPLDASKIPRRGLGKSRRKQESGLTMRKRNLTELLHQLGLRCEVCLSSHPYQLP